MKTLPEKVTLAAVPYRAREHEGAVVFTSEHGFHGCGTRIVFTRRCGIWYVELFDTNGNAVSVCHVMRAYEVVCEIYGGSHEFRNGEHMP